LRARGVVCVCCLAAAAAGLAGSLPGQVVDRVASACVLIQAVQGNTAHGGSGFFVGRDEVLTNYHVVRAAAEGEADLVVVIGTDPKTRKLSNARFVAGDEELDLALLRTDQASSNILRFGSDKALRLTQPAWVAGFPFGTQAGLEVTMTTGTLSALRRDENGALHQIQLDAAVNPGNSGGPVVDASGRVIGISQATLKPAVGSGMAIAIPCSVAENFLKVAQRARPRVAKLRVAGKSSRRGLRVVAAEKVEEPWGTSVRVVVRGTRGAEEALPFEVALATRRREVVGRKVLDVSGLEDREEKTFSIRLRSVDFKDLATCEVLE